MRYVAVALKVSRDLETWRSFKQSSREGSIVAGRCSWLSSVFATLWLRYCLFRTLKGFCSFCGNFQISEFIPVVFTFVSVCT